MCKLQAVLNVTLSLATRARTSSQGTADQAGRDFRTECRRSMTRPGKAVDNRVALLGAADNSALLPAPSVAEAQGTSGGGDRMRAVQEQVESVKGVMQQNVNQMLDNMDRAQHLETTTQELAGYASP